MLHHVLRKLAGFTLGAFTLITASQAAEKLSSPKPLQIRSALAYQIMDKNNPRSNYLKVALTGNPITELREKSSQINISLVIDRSGSMSGEKIRKARDAALMAVDMLGSEDILSVIGYDFSAEVIVPATKLRNKDNVKRQIRQALRADGNTALFAGVSKGINEVNKFLSKNKVNRVILLSDGQANVGPSSTSELGELGISAAKQGIAVTTIGLGDGYNEDLMTTLAGYSDGNHFFAQNAGDLELAFNREFKDVKNVSAQDVEVVIKVKHGKAKRLLGRSGKIRGNRVTVRLNQVYANQEKYVLLEIEPSKDNRQGEPTLAQVEVSYVAVGSEKKQRRQDAVKMLYTDDGALVEKTANEDILADVFVQQSNLANAKAIEQLDKGDTTGGGTTLYGSAKLGYRYKDTLSSPAAKAKVQAQINRMEAAHQAIKAAPAVRARKIITKNSYDTANQQSTTEDNMSRWGIQPSSSTAEQIEQLKIGIGSD